MSKNRQHHQIDFVDLPGGSVKGVTASQRFYREAFGWSFRQWGVDYIDTKDSGLGFGVNADPEHCPRAPLPVIYSKNIDESLARVTKAGGIVTKAVFSFPGGRRFHFRDPAGNELAVWSNL